MKKNIKSFLFVTLALIFEPYALGADMIHKCKNEEGAFIYQKSACGGNADTVSSWKPKDVNQSVVKESDDEKKKDNPTVLKLMQSPTGHYQADGSINDKTLSFVVDTGASFVTLPESVAHGALIYCDDKIRIDTANGIVDSCISKIQKLQFGPFLIQNVDAVIQPNLSQPLLGMNVLQQFKIQQNKGEMEISILEVSKSESN
jgi:clan AA aspartic protease (TIGR02281 family)